MLERVHKKFERIQNTEIYFLGLKVQYKREMKLPLNMVRKHVLLSALRPDYMHQFLLILFTEAFLRFVTIDCIVLSFQRIVKMNKTEDEEITNEEMSDEEIINLSEGNVQRLHAV